MGRQTNPHRFSALQQQIRSPDTLISEVGYSDITILNQSLASGFLFIQKSPELPTWLEPQNFVALRLMAIPGILNYFIPALKKYP